MNKIFYFLVVFFLIVFSLSNCSLFKDEEKNIKKSNRNYPVDTIVKPDPSLRGLKVSLPKPIINETWMQSTNNEAHNIEHPFVNNKIRLAW